MTNNRKRVYAFLELPWHVRVKRATDLGLTDDFDYRIPTEQERCIEWIRRAKLAGVLNKLMPLPEADTILNGPDIRLTD